MQNTFEFVAFQGAQALFGAQKIVEHGKNGAAAARHAYIGGKVFQIENGRHYARAMIGRRHGQGVVKSVADAALKTFDRGVEGIFRLHAESVEMGVYLLRGAADALLRHDEKFFPQAFKSAHGREFFASSSRAHYPAVHHVDHVAAHPKSDFFTFFLGDPEEFFRRVQDPGAVGGRAAHTGGKGDAFSDRDLHALARKFAYQFCGAYGGVFFARGNTVHAHVYPALFGGTRGDDVAAVDAHHEHVEIVIAVDALFEHVEIEIELGVCKYGNFIHIFILAHACA